MLEQWKAALEPLREHIRAADDGALSFAQTGLWAIFVLNGGAPVALPALNAIGAWNRPETLNASAAWFVVGLVAATATTLVAYPAQLSVSKAFVKAESWREMGLEVSYFLEDSVGNYKHARADAKSTDKKFHRCFEVTRWIAVATAAGPLLAFVYGAQGVL